PAPCHVPIASPSTTSCCASSRNWARRLATPAPRPSRCRCPASADAHAPPAGQPRAALHQAGARQVMKYLAAVLVLLLALLQYRLWLGEGGMREVVQLRHQIQEQLQENEALRERNRTLAAEVQDLKQGTTAIEERARTDLGMV